MRLLKFVKPKEKALFYKNRFSFNTSASEVEFLTK